LHPKTPARKEGFLTFYFSCLIVQPEQKPKTGGQIMSSYRNTFPRKNTFLAVIHVESIEQALRNVGIAEEGGADGVFLINHNIQHPQLIDCYLMVRKQFPTFWTGVNCLDLGRQALGYIPRNTQGLWTDSAGMFENGHNPWAAAEDFSRRRKEVRWDGIYFGGVAFKGQAPVTDVAAAALFAVPFVDVITTSGKQTGMVAEIEKIRKMKAAIGDHPLAIASGITPENVAKYMPHADCFLVATGISYSFFELNPYLVRDLEDAVRQ